MPIIVSGISLPFTDPPETAAEQARKLAGAAALSARIVRRAVDARHKNDIRFVYSVALEIQGDEAGIATKIPNSVIVKTFAGDAGFPPAPVEKIGASDRPVIVGFGPAGMFAALYLARAGLNPIVLERGASVERRILDVRAFFNGGSLDAESNVQFGEGGAGTFSDGKLTTRINNARCAYVLNEFVRHGAPKDILLQAKPHVGTDMLRGIVKSIRGEIVGLGGDIRFNTKLDDIVTANGQMVSVKTTGGEIEAGSLILAPGHSARDTFGMLRGHGVQFIPKPFSVGVRIEHLQSRTDTSMYGKFAGHPLLPRAEYQHSLRVGERAVYTFCMCPGGLVVPAASEHGGIVTNGMSEYARDRENANSALVVSVSPADFGEKPFDGIEFQRGLERAAFLQGGGDYRAPIQDAGSFLNGMPGFKLGKVTPSYTIGINNGNFDKLFPFHITKMLREGLRSFDRKQGGFAASDSILTGVETRTSSPVRITRGDNFQAAGISGLYPCGEGAGYAGGIVSAAVDGLRCAEALLDSVRSRKG